MADDRDLFSFKIHKPSTRNMEYKTGDDYTYFNQNGRQESYLRHTNQTRDTKNEGDYLNAVYSEHPTTSNYVGRERPYFEVKSKSRVNDYDTLGDETSQIYAEILPDGNSATISGISSAPSWIQMLDNPINRQSGNSSLPFPTRTNDTEEHIYSEPKDSVTEMTSSKTPTRRSTRMRIMIFITICVILIAGGITASIFLTRSQEKFRYYEGTVKLSMDQNYTMNPGKKDSDAFQNFSRVFCLSIQNIFVSDNSSYKNSYQGCIVDQFSQIRTAVEFRIIFGADTKTSTDSQGVRAALVQGLVNGSSFAVIVDSVQVSVSYVEGSSDPLKQDNIFVYTQPLSGQKTVDITSMSDTTTIMMSMMISTTTTTEVLVSTPGDMTTTAEVIPSTSTDLTTTAEVMTSAPGDMRTTAEVMTSTPGGTATTTEVLTSTRGDMTTTTELLTSTSGDMTATTDVPTSTPGDMTTTAEVPTSTPGDMTTTAEVPTSTPGDMTATADVPTSTPGDMTTTADVPTLTPGDMTTTAEVLTATTGYMITTAEVLISTKKDTTPTGGVPTFTPGDTGNITTTTEVQTSTPGDTTTTTEILTSTPGNTTTMTDVLSSTSEIPTLIITDTASEAIVEKSTSFSTSTTVQSLATTTDVQRSLHSEQTTTVSSSIAPNTEFTVVTTLSSMSNITTGVSTEAATKTTPVTSTVTNESMISTTRVLSTTTPFEETTTMTTSDPMVTVVSVNTYSQRVPVGGIGSFVCTASNTNMSGSIVKIKRQLNDSTIATINSSGIFIAPGQENKFSAEVSQNGDDIETRFNITSITCGDEGTFVCCLEKDNATLQTPAFELSVYAAPSNVELTVNADLVADQARAGEQYYHICKGNIGYPSTASYLGVRLKKSSGDGEFVYSEATTQASDKNSNNSNFQWSVKISENETMYVGSDVITGTCTLTQKIKFILEIDSSWNNGIIECFIQEWNDQQNVSVSKEINLIPGNYCTGEGNKKKYHPDGCNKWVICYNDYPYGSSCSDTSLCYDIHNRRDYCENCDQVFCEPEPTTTPMPTTTQYSAAYVTCTDTEASINDSSAVIRCNVTSEAFATINITHLSQGSSQEVWVASVSFNGDVVMNAGIDDVVTFNMANNPKKLNLEVRNIDCTDRGQYIFRTLGAANYSSQSVEFRVKASPGAVTQTVNADLVEGTARAGDRYNHICKGDIGYPTGRAYVGIRLTKSGGGEQFTYSEEATSASDIDKSNPTLWTVSILETGTLYIAGDTTSGTCTLTQEIKYLLQLDPSWNGGTMECFVHDRQSNTDTAVSADIALIPANYCTGETDNAIKTHPGGCNKWVVCSNGSPFGWACTDLSLCFNRDKGYCESCDQVTCDS